MSKEPVFMDVNEVSQVLGLSKSKSYGIIKGLNDELKERGYITIPGRVSRKFFRERLYGEAPEEQEG